MQHFTTAKQLNEAIRDARAQALTQAQADCGRGVFQSRGSYIYGRGEKLGEPQGAAETHAFTNWTSLQAHIADVAANHPDVTEITIEGGYNYAASPRAMQDFDYDPWASEWALTVWTRDPAPVAEEPAPAPALTAEQQTILADLRAAMARAEQEIAALPAATWVILWGTHALRTNGTRVGLQGSAVYIGGESFMREEAARFAQQAKDQEWPEPVRAMSSTEALATLIAANTALIGRIPGLCA